MSTLTHDRPTTRGTTNGLTWYVTGYRRAADSPSAIIRGQAATYPHIVTVRVIDGGHDVTGPTLDDGGLTWRVPSLSDPAYVLAPTCAIGDDVRRAWSELQNTPGAKGNVSAIERAQTLWSELRTLERTREVSVCAFRRFTVLARMALPV